MDSNTEDTQEITAALISLEYASAIGIARFKIDEGELTLYGERRMMSILAEYIDHLLLLFVKTEYNWSWRPAEIDFVNDELYPL